VTSGVVTPSALASMASKDLASSEMSQQREQIRKAAVKDVSTTMERSQLNDVVSLFTHVLLYVCLAVRPRRVTASRQVDAAPREIAHLR
jgi:hypothetical protein